MNDEPEESDEHENLPYRSPDQSPNQDQNEDQDPDWIPREREVSLCPCKSWKEYSSCCMPFHYGRAKPKTAEQLMRSRYSAYFFRRIEYLVETTHPDTKSPSLKRDLKKTVYQANWSKLTILNTSKGQKDDKTGKVEFVAEYYVDGEPYELHEVSRFKRYKGAWKYLDGKS